MLLKLNIHKELKYVNVLISREDKLVVAMNFVYKFVVKNSKPTKNILI
jgi:hypothetical protein